MVFLQDTLDVLLEILMNNSTDDDSDNKVFEALVSSLLKFVVFSQRDHFLLKFLYRKLLLMSLGEKKFIFIS